MHSNIKGERFILVSENWTGKEVVQHLLKAGKFDLRVIRIPRGFFYFMWAEEYLIELLGIRKRFLTSAMIKGQYEQKKICGEKIKSFINFGYSPISKLI